MVLKNGSAVSRVCTSCAKLWQPRLYSGVLDALDPGKLLVCLSIGTESLAAALDTHSRPLVTGNKLGHTCTLLRTAVYVKFTRLYG